MELDRAKEVATGFFILVMREYRGYAPLFFKRLEEWGLDTAELDAAYAALASQTP